MKTPCFAAPAASLLAASAQAHVTLECQVAPPAARESRAEWTELPRAGQKLSELRSPAAALEILPAAGGAGAHSH